jgi:hypothetical protein
LPDNETSENRAKLLAAKQCRNLGTIPQAELMDIVCEFPHSASLRDWLFGLNPYQDLEDQSYVCFLYTDNKTNGVIAYKFSMLEGYVDQINKSELEIFDLVRIRKLELKDMDIILHGQKTYKLGVRIPMYIKDQTFSVSNFSTFQEIDYTCLIL